MPSNYKPISQHLDYGYSWVILIAVSSMSFFQLGIVKVFGVFIPEFIEQLQLSAFAVGLSCSIGIGLRALLGPLWGALTHHFTYRTLGMSGGVICTTGLIAASLSQSLVHLCFSMALLSIGSGLSVVAKVVIVDDFFEKKFGVANGIAFTGGAIGMTILAPIIEFFIDIYGWRGAMLLYGSMTLNMCVAGALMIQHERSQIPPQKGRHRTKNVNDTNGKTPSIAAMKDFLRNLGFSVLRHHRILFVYLTAMMLHELVLCGWVLFLVSYTISIGYTAQVASFLSALGGGGALLGRLVIGPFIDRGLLSGQTAFFLFLLGGSLMMFSYPFVQTYWVLCLISLIAGFFLGSGTPVYVIILKEIVHDEKRFAGAIGQHYMWRSFGMLAGGPLTGWLYDLTGNFYFSFMTLAGLEIVGALLVCIRPSHFRRLRLQSKTTHHAHTDNGNPSRTVGDVNLEHTFAQMENEL